MRVKKDAKAVGDYENGSDDSGDEEDQSRSEDNGDEGSSAAGETGSRWEKRDSERVSKLKELGRQRRRERREREQRAARGREADSRRAGGQQREGQRKRKREGEGDADDVGGGPAKQCLVNRCRHCKQRLERLVTFSQGLCVLCGRYRPRGEGGVFRRPLRRDKDGLLVSQRPKETCLRYRSQQKRLHRRVLPLAVYAGD